jgi:hypothetical protein
MSKNVFANGREISGKKDDNKSVASVPDVCLSPPSPPAGPVPIPYPNTAQASDTSEGSKTVKIGGGEVGLKNSSNYKKSTGNEAATKTLGMGVISHNIQGKLKHAAWSMDVKVEGHNVIRHMDMVTQNHMNCPQVPGIDLAAQQPPTGDPECVELEILSRIAVANDLPGGVLPPDVVHATASDSNGNNYRAAQPGDYPNTGASNGYSQTTDSSRHPCGGARHNPNPQGNRNHCENKIMHDAIDRYGLRKGGSLTMRINWNTGAPPPPNGPRLSNSPCRNCMGSICETALECGIEIFICKGDPLEKVKAPCERKEHRAGTKGFENTPDMRGHDNNWVGGWGSF